MDQDNSRLPDDIEKERIELERYKAQLDYKKFVLGSVFVAIAIATIPPLFQLATAALEYVKSDADLQAKQQAFRDDYIKGFINNALNQDIELRIRFAQYFARVSTEPFRQDWVEYLKDLRGTRSEIRSQIDKMEAEWQLEKKSQQRDDAEIERLERNLAWAYKEVGYVERNRSAAANPRAPEQSPPEQKTPFVYLGRFADPYHFLREPITWNPSGEQVGKLAPVQVPAGFVTTFDSVPRAFWSLFPEGGVVYAAVIHDYLYWTQTRPRAEADEIFRLVLQELKIEPAIIALLYQAAKMNGQLAWNENTKLKAQGEKRLLKEFPNDPQIRWADWKKRPSVFSE